MKKIISLEEFKNKFEIIHPILKPGETIDDVMLEAYNAYCNYIDALSRGKK